MHRTSIQVVDAWNFESVFVCMRETERDVQELTCEVVWAMVQYQSAIRAVMLNLPLHCYIRLSGFERRWDAETGHKASVQVLDTCDFAGVLYSRARERSKFFANQASVL